MADILGIAEQVRVVAAALETSTARLADLAAELEKQVHPPELTIYGQRDARWSNQLLGFSNVSTIGGWGCLLCDVAMLASYVYGEEITPPMANQRLKDVDGFVAGEANMKLAKVAEAYPKLTLAGYYKFPYPQPADTSILDRHLEKGLFPIIEADMKPATVLVDQHWVLVTRKVADQVYEIADPWSGRSHEMPPAYCKPGWTARQAIFRISLYGGTTP